MDVTCRVCFNGFKSELCLPLSSASNLPDLLTIQQVLENVIPDMNLALIHDPRICKSCWGDISKFYNMKRHCLESERKVIHSLQERGLMSCVLLPLVNCYSNIQPTIKGEEIELGIKREREFDKVEKSNVPGADSEPLLQAYLENETKSFTKTTKKKQKNKTLVGRDMAKKTDSKASKKHKNKKPLRCSLCLTTCDNYTEALRHSTECHGIHVLFPCRICKEFFADHDASNLHLQTHGEIFTCHICPRIYVSKRSLIAHLKTKHPENPVVSEYKKRRILYTCDVCGRSVQNRKLLEEHKESHDVANRKYMCDKCGKCFKQRSVLYNHNRKHENIWKHECPYCPKKFYRKSCLENHKTVHTKDKRYECKVCSKRFTQYSSVLRHMRIHTGERPYKCSTCGRTYIQSNELRKHERKNNCAPGDVQVFRRDCQTGRSPNGYKYREYCNICGKDVQKGYLQVHLRIHTGERSEICEFCGKSFAQFESLKRHMMIHTGEKPYRCELCGCTFRQTVELQAHTWRKHTGEKPYECKICNVKFAEFSTLSRHRKAKLHKLAEGMQK